MEPARGAGASSSSRTADGFCGGRAASMLTADTGQLPRPPAGIADEVDSATFVLSVNAGARVDDARSVGVEKSLKNLPSDSEPRWS